MVDAVAMPLPPPGFGFVRELNVEAEGGGEERSPFSGQRTRTEHREHANTKERERLYEFLRDLLRSTKFCIVAG